MKTMQHLRFGWSTAGAMILGCLFFLHGTALAQQPYITQDRPTAISLMEGDFMEGGQGSIVYSVYNPFNFDLYTYETTVNNTFSGGDPDDTLQGYNFANGGLPFNTVIPAGQSNTFTVHYTTGAAHYGTDSGNSLASIGIQVYTQPNGQGAHWSVQSPQTYFSIYDYGMGGVFPPTHIHVDPEGPVVVNPAGVTVIEGASGILTFSIVNAEAYPFTITSANGTYGWKAGDPSDNLLTATMNALVGLEIPSNSVHTVAISFTTPSDDPEYPPHLDSGLNSVTLDISGSWDTGGGLVTHDATGTGFVTVMDIPEPSAFGLQVLGGLMGLVLLWRRRS